MKRFSLPVPERTSGLKMTRRWSHEGRGDQRGGRETGVRRGVERRCVLLPGTSTTRVGLVLAAPVATTSFYTLWFAGALPFDTFLLRPLAITAIPPAAIRAARLPNTVGLAAGKGRILIRGGPNATALILTIFPAAGALRWCAIRTVGQLQSSVYAPEQGVVLATAKALQPIFAVVRVALSLDADMSLFAAARCVAAIVVVALLARAVWNTGHGRAGIGSQVQIHLVDLYVGRWNIAAVRTGILGVSHSPSVVNIHSP